MSELLSNADVLMDMITIGDVSELKDNGVYESAITFDGSPILVLDGELVKMNPILLNNNFCNTRSPMVSPLWQVVELFGIPQLFYEMNAKNVHWF